MATEQVKFAPQILGINRFNFSGKVVKKNFKYSKEGNLFGSLMIKIPAKNEKYSTVMWLKVFNSKDGTKNLADEINENVAEDTNWSFYGYISNSKFEKDGNTEYRTDFIINRFQEALESESKPAEPIKDEVPF